MKVTIQTGSLDWLHVSYLVLLWPDLTNSEPMLSLLSRGCSITLQKPKAATLATKANVICAGTQCQSITRQLTFSKRDTC